MSPKRVRRSWLLLALLAPATLVAQTVERGPFAPLEGPNQWRSSGPGVASVTLVVPDRSSEWTLYCLAGKTIFKTASAGDRWSLLGKGLNAQVYDLAINPSRPQVLLAAGFYTSSHTFDIFKSVDGGQSWSPRNIAFAPEGNLDGLVWDEGRPNRAFLLSDQALRMSLDDGETWTRFEVIPFSVPNGELTAIAVDKGSEFVYVVASNGGLYRSDDPQAHWTLISTPFVDNSVRRILTRPEHPGTLYAATFQGFMVSRDGGLTWVVSGSGLPQGSVTERSITSLVLDTVDPDVLYAVPYFGSSVFRSTDDGETWSPFLTSPVSLVFLAVTSKGVFFAGNFASCLRRSPGQADWSQINTGLPGQEAGSLAIDAFSSAEIYAVSRASVYVYFSEDAGRSWSVRNTGSQLLEGASTVVADLSKPGVAYLGTGGCSPPRPTSSCYGNLYKTTDRGSNWRRLAVPGGPGSVLAIAVDPAQSDVLYATGFVGSSGGVGFRSRDGGESWAPFGSGFPSSFSNHILVDARSPGTVLVATASGVFRSTDGGDSWQPAGLAIGISALAQDPRSGYVYAGSDNGIFASRDGGQTWILQASIAVSRLAAGPRSGLLYAAVSGEGIQVTSDGGLSWSQVGYGFPDEAHGFFPIRVNDLAVSSDGSTLYASTTFGVYSLRLRNPVRVQPR